MSPQITLKKTILGINTISVLNANATVCYMVSRSHQWALA